MQPPTKPVSSLRSHKLVSLEIQLSKKYGKPVEEMLQYYINNCSVQVCYVEDPYEFSWIVDIIFSCLNIWLELSWVILAGQKVNETKRWTYNMIFRRNIYATAHVSRQIQKKTIQSIYKKANANSDDFPILKCNWFMKIHTYWMPPLCVAVSLRISKNIIEYLSDETIPHQFCNYFHI